MDSHETGSAQYLPSCYEKGSLMVEQMSLSTKLPIVGGVLMLALLIWAVVSTHWDGRFANISSDGIEEVRYLGERGFYNPPAGAQNKCKTKYNFWAFIKGNVIKSSDESMSFLSVLDEDGRLNISGIDLIPLSDIEFRVTGPVGNAVMYSEVCGEGYFRLVPQ